MQYPSPSPSPSSSSLSPSPSPSSFSHSHSQSLSPSPHPSSPFQSPPPPRPLRVSLANKTPSPLRPSSSPSSSPSSPTPPLPPTEVSPSTIRHDLLIGLYECSSRCLLESSKFCGELLHAMSENTEDNNVIDENISLPPPSTPLYVLAKTYFELREFDRCAFTLRGDNSLEGIFLRNYAKWMGGEKRRYDEYDGRRGMGTGTAGGNNEQKVNSNTPPTSSSPSSSSSSLPPNKESKGILIEYLSHFTDSSSASPSPSLDAFNLYLFSLVLNDNHQKDKSLEILLRSLRLFPVNWSGWILLVSLITHRNDIDSLSLSDSPHWIHQFFYSSVLLEFHSYQPNEIHEFLDSLRIIFPYSSHLASQKAMAFYNSRMFNESEECFKYVRESDPFRLEGMDTYSNILYVREDRASLSHLAHSAAKIEKYSVYTNIILGNFFSLRGDHERAIQFFRRSLLLDQNYLSSWTLMGHEYIELRNTSMAIECYRRAVEINSKDYRAWYGLGQTYEILSLPTFSIYYFKKASVLRPYDGRMWMAMADCYEKCNQIDHCIKCLMRGESAEENSNVGGKEGAGGEGEGGAKLKLAKMFIKRGDKEMAAVYYNKILQKFIQRNTKKEQKEEGDNHTPTSASSTSLPIPLPSFFSSPSLPSDCIESMEFLCTFYLEHQRYDEAESLCLPLMEVGGGVGNTAETAKKILHEIRKRRA